MKRETFTGDDSPATHRMKNSKTLYRRGKWCWEWWDAENQCWVFTQRTDREIEEWCEPLHPESNQVDEVDHLLELYGETLDEPIPDDLAAMLLAT